MENNFNTQIVANMRNFFYELENYKNQFQYVSVTVSDYLKAKYKETYDSLFVVKCLMLEDEFCKNNNVSKEKYEDFLNKYIHVGDIIDEHNQSNKKKKTKTNKSNLISLNGKDIAKLIVDACIDISVKYLYGQTMLVNVLKGNKPKGLVKSGFEKSVYFSALKDIRTLDIDEMINVLLEAGVFNKTEGMYPVLSVNERVDVNNLSDEVFEKIEKIVKRNMRQKIKRIEKIENNETLKFEGFDIVIDENGEVLTDLELLKVLNQKRKEIVKEKNVSSFLVASNRVLVGIATYKPKTKEECLKIKGVGENWFKSYGKTFLDLVK